MANQPEIKNNKSIKKLLDSKRDSLKNLIQKMSKDKESKGDSFQSNSELEKALGDDEKDNNKQIEKEKISEYEIVESDFSQDIIEDSNDHEDNHKVNKDSDIENTDKIDTIKNSKYKELIKREGEIPSDKELFSRKDIHYNHKFATLRNRKRRIILIASLCTFFLILIGVGSAWAISYVNQPFDDDKSVNNLVATENFEDPFYMLLIGTDTREEEGTYQLTDGRSDSCMLVRVDPKAYVVSVISIPRDTKITYKGQTEKFNAAFNNGGIAASIDVVNQMFGIQISHYAQISFNGLTDLVNAVGGIKVNVPSAINDPKAGVSVPAGEQILNGEQALSFSRSRDFSDGDFTRTADQRVLIEAMIKQGFKMDLLQLPGIIQAAKKFIKTDFSIAQMYSLVMQFRNAEQLTIYTSMVPSTTGSVNGASYCFTDTDALDRMVKLMERNEDPNFVEITSGAKICSSRDQQAIDERRNAHYQEHPDCPGKASNSTSKKNKNNITDSKTAYSSKY